MPSTAQRLERREREVEAARRISQALFQRLHVEDVVEQALEIALEVVNAGAGSVLLAHPESQQLVFYHAIGEKSPARGTAFPWDQGIAGTTFQTGEAVVVDNAKQDTRHFIGIDVAFGHITQDLIALPLKRWEGDPIGVLEVMNKKSGRLDKDDVAILTIISAITAISIEQARLFEEVKVAQVAHLLGDISHDIKNMMMPIIYGAWLLQNKPESPTDSEGGPTGQQPSHEILSMIRSNARCIQNRVKEITDAVKGLSSPPTFRPCQVSEIITMVIQTLRLLAEEKSISLQAEDLQALPSIQADERRLFNAFYNLISNAIDEVPGGGCVTIRGSTDATSKTILVSVQDTGHGMPPEVQQSLFTSRVISRKTGGTGLGTKIVKDVVDAHGGEITVDSQVGVGSTFHIRLPIHPPTASIT